MGLDMYLNAKRSVYPKKGQRTIDLDDLNHNLDDYTEDEFGCSNGIVLSETVGYWRKANAIHGWFVDNCQNGIDECQESYVSNDDLKELYGICKNILKMLDGKKFVLKKGSESWMTENGKEKKGKTEFTFSFLDFENIYKDGDIWKYDLVDEDGSVEKYISDNLPPTNGFFFGSNEIDGGYFYDVFKTILILDRLFKNFAEWERTGANYYITYQASW